MISRRSLLCLAAGTMLSRPASAQGEPSAASTASDDEWQRILAGAKKEGEVILYSSQPPAVLRRLKTDFEQLYPGIALQFDRSYGGGALLTRLEQERQTGIDGADVAIATEIVAVAMGPGFADLLDQGRYKPPVGPAARHWPQPFMTGRGAPILALEPIIMAYNTDQVKEPLAGYQDLLKPDFKGRIGAIELVAIAVIAWYDWIEKTQGPEFLPKLAAQKPRLFTSAVPNAQAVASGEVAVTAFTNPSSTFPLIDQKAPIKVVVPKPSLGIRYGGVVLGWSKRPNAAQVFMDYMMSPRGQAVWTGRGEAASPLPGIPGSVEVTSVQPYDPTGYPAEFTEPYRKKWAALFKA